MIDGMGLRGMGFRQHASRRKTSAKASIFRRREDVTRNLLRPDTSTEGGDFVEETTLQRSHVFTKNIIETNDFAQQEAGAS